MAPAEHITGKSPRIVLDSLNLGAAEGVVAEAALTATRCIVEAAQLLGVTRQRLYRLIIKHRIMWPMSVRAAEEVKPCT